MRRLLTESDLEVATFGNDSVGIVPLEIRSRPVVQVDSFPVRIVSSCLEKSQPNLAMLKSSLTPLYALTRLALIYEKDREDSQKSFRRR